MFVERVNARLQRLLSLQVTLARTSPLDVSVYAKHCHYWIRRRRMKYV
jgi:hypothetical protein